MTQDQSKSGTNAAVVIVVVLILLSLPCAAGLVFLGGMAVLRFQAPPPSALPPVPGANAPLPGTAPPGKMAIPGSASITVHNIQWSQNLFDAANEVLTKAKYDQIKPGMTYEELVSVLGIPENIRPPDIELVGPDSDVGLKGFGGPEQ